MSGHQQRAIDFIKKWQKLAGRKTVLLPVPWGEKGCFVKGWQKITWEDTQNTQYLEEIIKGNIGVLMGGHSAGLCCIDIDHDDALAPFFQQNPRLRDTFRVRGARGVKLFVKILGDFPNSSKIKEFGEWLADRTQSVVYGQHPSGCQYQIVHEAKVVELEFRTSFGLKDTLYPGTSRNHPRQSNT